MNVGKEIRSFRVTNNSTHKRSTVSRALVLGAVFLSVLFVPINLTPTLAVAAAASPVNVWWPTNGSHVTGTQPFKAMVQGLDVNSYDMYWQVDGGGLVSMYNSSTDYPHKEAQVDLSGWTWHGSGPYVVTFVAKQGGNVVAQTNVTIYIDNGLPGYSPSAPQQPIQTVQTVQAALVPTQQSAVVNVAPTPTPATNNLSNFYVEPGTDAAHQVAAWQSSRPADAAKIAVLANTPTAKWFGEWSGDIQSATAQYVNAAAAAGKVPVLVAYDIPQRDCGGYSAGGVNSKDAYLNWIGGMSRGIGSNQATVILEPDALPALDCLSPADQSTRESMLASAVSILKSNSNTKVYLDAGNVTWQSPQTMAQRLGAANIAGADGFSLNVSGFESTSASESYGQQISQLLGGKHFVIDTSRNGNGSNGQWCNPSGRAIGPKPTTNTGNSLVDAFLWLKTPGESDGNCNGGPNAGVWWPDYALSLVNNAH